MRQMSPGESVTGQYSEPACSLRNVLQDQCSPVISSDKLLPKVPGQLFPDGVVCRRYRE